MDMVTIHYNNKQWQSSGPLATHSIPMFYVDIDIDMHIIDIAFINECVLIGGFGLKLMS